MITYNGQNLFSSGPCTIRPGALQTRDAVSDAPGTIGSTVISQGVSPRTVEQTGMLLADTEAELRALLDAIAIQVGVGPATLVDEQGNDWLNCVMRRVEPGRATRLGPRYAQPYSITYLQTTP